MGERVQPGGRVDRDVYEDFRQFVKKRHGAVRGNLGTELERAIQDRMEAANGGTPYARIENDIATIKAMLADGEADGGEAVPMPSQQESTHTHDGEKPAANAPRQHKIQYLMDEMPADRESGEITRDDLRHTIESEYGFDSDTVDQYVELILSRVTAKEHPVHGNTYVWGEKYEEAVDWAREQAEKELGEVADE